MKKILGLLLLLSTGMGFSEVGCNHNGFYYATTEWYETFTKWGEDGKKYEVTVSYYGTAELEDFEKGAAEARGKDVAWGWTRFNITPIDGLSKIEYNIIAKTLREYFIFQKGKCISIKIRPNPVPENYWDLYVESWIWIKDDEGTIVFINSNRQRYMK